MNQHPNTELSWQSSDVQFDAKTCTKAICVLHGSSRRAQGQVSFHQCHAHSPVEVQFNFSHLSPHKMYAIHIHEFGDLRHGCESLGGHWNPEQTTHGSFLYPQYPRHAGDLINNITTNSKGNFKSQYLDDTITLYGKKSILGRSIVLHRHRDDLGVGGTTESLNNGCAGQRIMCGVIGYSQI